MIRSFIRFSLQLLTISAALTVVYFNVISVSAGHVLFLQERTEGLQPRPYPPGVYWIWTAFVPGKWKQLPVQIRTGMTRHKFGFPLQFTDYLELPESFRVQLTLSYRAEISVETARTHLDPVNPDVNAWQNQLQARIHSLLEKKFAEFYRTDRDLPFLKERLLGYFAPIPESPFQADLGVYLKDSGMKVTWWAAEKIHVPDPVLYAEQVRNTADVIAARRAALAYRIGADARQYERELKNEGELRKAKEFMNLFHRDERVLDFQAIEKMKSGRIVLERGGPSERVRVEKTEEPVLPVKPTETDDEEAEGVLPPIRR